MTTRYLFKIELHLWRRSFTRNESNLFEFPFSQKKFLLNRSFDNRSANIWFIWVKESSGNFIFCSLQQKQKMKQFNWLANDFVFFFKRKCLFSNNNIIIIQETTCSRWNFNSFLNFSLTFWVRVVFPEIPCPIDWFIRAF